MPNFDVILTGGPDHLPRQLRFQQVQKLTDKIKLNFGAGYEHFVRDETNPVDEEGVPIFRWVGRTAIAE
ncbi:DUF5988 family protein [Actinosynnema sp. CS-041913]|uniref:DUF5988 family protein n=1 Tax=Actinosynnema sp. CS-041913 TaxID=3239917 RepID=UPI003D8F7C80